MPFKFPYTNFQELNLDWIIKKVKDLSKQIEDDSSIVAEYTDRLLAVEDKADNAEATATAADARATGANTTANSALTLATQAKQTAEIADLSTTLLGLKIGDLSSLYTTAKDTIVNAINEVWSIFHNATAVTNVTPAGTDPAVTYSNGVFTFDLPEGGDPDAVTHAELDAAIDELSEELDNKADVIIDTVSGDIAGFPDGTATPLKALVINVEPVQAGSGDPSPNNIRPISGWTGLTVTRTGKNLIDRNTTVYPRYQRDIAGAGYTWNVSSDSTSIAVPVKPNTTYTLSGYPSNSQMYRLGVLHGALPTGNEEVPMYSVVRMSSYATFGATRTYTTDSEATYLIIQLSQDVFSTFLTDSQLEIGSAATAYEPYISNFYPVNFGETVYGAKPDIISGNMLITLFEVDCDNIDFTLYQSSVGRWAYDFTNIKQNADGSKLIGLIAEEYKEVTSNAYNNVTGTMYLQLNSNRLHICTGSENIRPTGKLVFPLATPTETTITPVPVTGLEGYNAVWSDAGSVEVTYKADTKGYIDKLIAQVQALALGG